MKKITLLALSALIAFAIQAQKNVYLQIDHYLGANAFAMNTAAANNLGNDFKVTRLDYYISRIVIVHDGGQQTAVPNKWLLVKANNAVNELLGSYSITNIEAVKFSIGVEPEYNHLDPAGYPSSHPLSPKSPSMHWGWSAGYIFAAFNGTSGANFAQTFEYHGIGDNVFYTLTIPTTGSANGNDLTISLKADYEMALKDINVSSGGIVHSEVGPPKTMLQNFVYHVFTTAGNASMNIDEIEAVNIKIGPNPSNQVVSISAEQMSQGAFEVLATDITGKVVMKSNVESGKQTQLQFNKPGMYFISILQNGIRIKIEKVLILK